MTQGMACVLITCERQKQDKKFGYQQRPPKDWLPILIEEVGEMAKEIHEKRWKRYQQELIQVAAVAMAMLENLPEGL